MGLVKGKKKETWAMVTLCPSSKPAASFEGMVVEKWGESMQLLFEATRGQESYYHNSATSLRPVSVLAGHSWIAFFGNHHLRGLDQCGGPALVQCFCCVPGLY